MALWVSAWGVFLVFESSWIHSAQEHENRFTFLMGMYVAFITLFTEDSPLGGVGNGHPGLGYTVVFVAGYIFCVWNRATHRYRLGAAVRIGGTLRKVSTHSGLADQRLVRGVVAQVVSACQDLDRSWLPSAPSSLAPLLDWVRGSLAGRGDEMGRVQAALETANAPELNEVLLQLNAAATPGAAAGNELGGERNYISLFVYKVKDRWPHKARSRLLKFLCEDRLSDLNVRSRVLVLHALQQLKLQAHPRSEYYVRMILKGKSGGELVRLKLEMDSKGDYHSLHKLVFRDVSSREERRLILEHIEQQGRAMLSHMRQGGRVGSKLLRARPWRKVHVISH